MLIDPKAKSKSLTQRFTYKTDIEDKMHLMIFEDDMLSVRHNEAEERDLYPVGVLYDPREKPQTVIKWALDHDYIKQQFAQKRYPELLKKQ
jgi:hypothetical protein